MSENKRDWSLIAEDARARFAQMREGAGEVREGLIELLRDGAELSRERATETREALAEWWATPMTMEERLRDVRVWQSEARSEAVERTKYLAMRTKDNTRSIAAYARLYSLQGRNGQRQAYAPFTLSFHEAKASEVLALMPEDRVASMIPLAERIRDAQLKMGEKTRGYNDCGQCERYYVDEHGENEAGGQCCSGWVGQWFRPVDGLFRRLLGEQAPVWPKFHHDWSRCGYMGERGCLLPAGTRPVICVGFYCDNFREHLLADGVWGDLAPEFKAIRESLRTLEFRYNMTRRFIGAGDDRVVDSSIGHIWSKLMRLYAAFDQITPSQQTAGVDAISDTRIGDEEGEEDSAATAQDEQATEGGSEPPPQQADADPADDKGDGETLADNSAAAERPEVG